jgi:acyl-CoA synthetase (AMP-forming)/AMP-acid ligase II
MLEMDRELIINEPHKITSVGRAEAYLEARIVDDQGRDVPRGVAGEAIFRSPASFIGYYDNPEATTAAIDKDGWIYTGDILKQDEEGLYYFVDRKKDMIKTGGENVFCQEVEGVIYTHPAVAECAVIGLPDPKWGELLAAVVKTKQGATATAEEIIQVCKEKLSSYKAPKKVFFVDEFPTSSVGKIQKFKLREMLG